MAKNINEFVVDKVCFYLQQRDEKLTQVRKKLKQTERLLNAYIVAIDMHEYSIEHTFCKHADCNAIYVSDNSDNTDRSVCLNCISMRWCKSCNEMYCDLHHEDHTTTCTCDYEWQECCGCFKQ
jgi:hypothetical protein